jgi:hypothetical protein
VGEGLVVGEVVDGDHLDVGAGGLDGAEEVAADAAKSIDANADCHVISAFRGGRVCRVSRGEFQ